MTYTATAPDIDRLDQPLYGASIGQAFSRFWRKYVTFSGRASRSEFWWWWLISLIVAAVLQGIGWATSDFSDARNPQFGWGYLPYTLWNIATFIPNLALNWRRLHDSNHSGLWVLIGLVPLVGWIVLLVFYLLDSDPQGRRFDRA